MIAILTDILEGILIGALFNAVYWGFVFFIMYIKRC